eukprot:CAMPEP_0195290454 /NCGR_PEP_ID=MMETSP0707-20130614/6308_1 /TAXON_ID=33640 /ORGANISM="Asterionellopsis glacialis, Strain CCMP134" /LENGTH=456 /DNA_ID=CAMNT_0040350585 /DNA_START=14 /DNA_END=1384 /DNA_ORIENTATION=+
MAQSSTTNTLLVRRLYRTLLQAAKPFTSPSADAAILTSLLSRTDINYTREEFDELTLNRLYKNPLEFYDKEKPLPQHMARDLSRSYKELRESYEISENPSFANIIEGDENTSPHRLLFRWLLKEVIAGGLDDAASSIRQQSFPSQVDTHCLRNIIRREFRFDGGAVSPRFDEKTRRQVAFTAIHALNDKLTYAESLGILKDSHTNLARRKRRNEKQRAKHISPLPLDPAEYLKAGCFLIAHPLLLGFFHQSVICLLEHTESGEGNGGTYGLVVNRIGNTLGEVIRSDSMPEKLSNAFSACPVREGGPVHVSLQMVHACEPEQQESLGVGGTVLTMLPSSNDITSTAIDSDRAIYFQGNVEEAADAVVAGDLKKENVSFYVGASCWTVGQLQNEIERGFWYPVSAPPEIVLDQPKKDLWLSMMCALGEDEANLTHLLVSEVDNVHECNPCDSFFDEK